jgi:hypothetical protein
VPAVQTARDLGGADRGAGGPAGTGQPGECPVGRILGIDIAMLAASCGAGTLSLWRRPLPGWHSQTLRLGIVWVRLH